MKLGGFFVKSLLLVALVLPAFGVETSSWQVGSFDEFLQGTLNGLSLSKQGDVTLAPEARTIFNPDEALALSLARDSHGNIYVGTGHQGKVFRVGPDEKSSAIFVAQEPDIFALAVGPDGSLYVGSSPEGKVYKVAADGKSSVFYNPRTKYIWALQFDSQGRLYVATGDKGQIFRVDPSGKSELFFDSKQTHIMCLRLDAEGNLLAGSVPNGLIYRLTPQGKAFVIYQASLPEVHDLAIDPQGRIFAAVLGGPGNKGFPEIIVPPSPGGAGGEVTTVTVTASTDSLSDSKGQVGQEGASTASFNRSTPQIPTLLPMSMGGGHGALIEILPDASAETIWSSNTESIFGLAVRNNHVLFTTDSNGRVLDLNARADDGSNLSIMTETHESLATRLLVGGAELYAATSNVAKLVRIGSSPAREGTFESQVKDTKFVSRWGVLAWRGAVPENCTMQFYTRSGNSDRPDHTWSDWAGPYHDPEGSPIASPSARYVQWKAVLHGDASTSPTLNEVTLSYLNQNLPPQIHSLNVSTSSERTSAASAAAASPMGGAISISSSPVGMGFGVGTPPATPGKTPITLTWQADDPNGDQLTYSLYVKATDEQEWHLLKDKVHQLTYTIDPGSLPDGKYVAKLVASDEESNPPQWARKSELLSAPFWVDNTPPEVRLLKKTANGSAAEVQFSVRDSTSPLHSAETSLDGQDWRDIVSDDGIVDSRQETFTIKLNDLAPGEHVVALRAYDTSGNIGVGKALIQISGARNPERRP